MFCLSPFHPHVHQQAPTSQIRWKRGGAGGGGGGGEEMVIKILSDYADFCQLWEKKKKDTFQTLSLYFSPPPHTHSSVNFF